MGVAPDARGQGIDGLLVVVALGVAGLTSTLGVVVYLVRGEPLHPSGQWPDRPDPDANLKRPERRQSA